MWKHGDMCSKAVLIGRGLDLRIKVLGMQKFHCSILRVWMRADRLVGTQEVCDLHEPKAKGKQTCFCDPPLAEGKWLPETQSWDGWIRHAPLAQLVEQLTLNQRVPGSSP